ncbi:hypothetical protein [Veronia pacifica]|uniref:Fis family transcriptional regulator n=2 Tax=Veronia pacifica TaxID=1080227 RepID=A0A1C3EMS8_9GAMM|nr:hypothetical protein A8L45_06065 [Veronia pacifica]
MRKTDKKRENALRTVLTDVCEIAQREYRGFEWLTHLVNYENFPRSLKIICIFNTNADLEQADTSALSELIRENLASIEVKIKDINQHVRFDTEEMCEYENNGKWNERLQ